MGQMKVQQLVLEWVLVWGLELGQVKVPQLILVLGQAGQVLEWFLV